MMELMVEGLAGSKNCKVVTNTKISVGSGVRHAGVFILTLSQRLEMRLRTCHILSLNSVSSPRKWACVYHLKGFFVRIKNDDL